ncbi:prepilin-type N-terminal cleavage/methylation domain-containing protein [Acidithiobacillus ferridurans]|nr:prepilin-type N-terminal cleavage/methylation domain-containing protein [Acidithiobacillus ferridurans]
MSSQPLNHSTTTFSANKLLFSLFLDKQIHTQTNKMAMSASYCSDASTFAIGTYVMLIQIQTRAQHLRQRLFRVRPESPDTNQSERGFTLVELIIVLVILGILAAVFLSKINLGSAKGKTLYLALTSTAHSAELFDASLGTYPTVYGATFNPTFGKSAADNTTGADLTNTWNGPYGKARNIGTNGNLHLDNVATGVTLTFSPLNSGATGALPNGLAYQYAVVANNVPNSIAAEAVKICNGAGNTSATNGGSCTLVAGTGTTSTVYYIFAQNQDGAY